MATLKRNYDAAFGGDVTLENHVSTYRYAASAVHEMEGLLSEIRNPRSKKLIFQTLPKHMRRRAMSHHPKRLPRKYRFIHRSQMAKSGTPCQRKRPSRKYRRRPNNLLRHYLRRQRKHVWLETHIWHARRFHMIERWGYRLPYASCDKTYRACYRASAEHCLLQDISFYACLQVEGTINEMRKGFARLSHARCGLSIVAKTYRSGKREGSIEMFKDNQYPEGALGRVNFIWKPLDADTVDSEDVQRTVWIWVHPAAYLIVLEEIIKVFELKAVKSKQVDVKIEDQSYGHNEPASITEGVFIKKANESTNSLQSKTQKHQENEEQETPKLDDVPLNNTNNSKTKVPKVKKINWKFQRRLQFITKNLAHERVKQYENATRSVKLSELKDTMNRFRLTGPLSHAVLTRVLKVKQLDVNDDNGNSTASRDWLYTLCETQKSFAENHQIQANYWQQCGSLSSPTELISNTVIALNIQDPRLSRPKKRTKAIAQELPLEERNAICNAVVNVPDGLANSCLWSAEIRKEICENMLSTRDYCGLRGKNAIVPGMDCAFERDIQAVPILLIQRPGSQQWKQKRLGYGCGWDIILPAGYGMSVWLSFIMWGAKPGGLRELASVARELGTDQHLPDTLAGKQEAAIRYEESYGKYFRLPPNKRRNYQKLAIVSPFRVPFAELVRDWQTNQIEPPNLNNSNKAESHFYVLRDQQLLEDLICACSLQKKILFPKEISLKSIISLQVHMKSRGNLTDNSLICLPTLSDLKRNLRRIKHNNHHPVFSEPLMPDRRENQRKVLRLQHRKLLKRMRARRVREKRKKQETSTTKVRIRPAGTAQLVAAQFKKMCSLWLPEEFSTPYSIRKQCSRDVIGYVTNSNFCFTEAAVCGVGYVTSLGLKSLIEVCRKAHLKEPMCLVRTTNSRHYRFASIKLNL